MHDQNFKNQHPTKFDFLKKIRNAQTYFLFLFYNVYTQKKEDEREAPWKISTTLYFLKPGI